MPRKKHEPSLANEAAIAAGNQWAAHCKGWACGARAGAPDPDVAKHDDERIRNAYNLGYGEGLAARNAAQVAAGKRYGYESSVLRGGR